MERKEKHTLRRVTSREGYNEEERGNNITIKTINRRQTPLCTSFTGKVKY
jgi:hypothetical protein